MLWPQPSANRWTLLGNNVKCARRCWPRSAHPPTPSAWRLVVIRRDGEAVVAGDFMSLMGSTSKPCASGGRGFSFQSDAIRANAAERFRAARIAFLRKYPFRAMRERNLAPPVGGAFSCRTLGTLGDGLTCRYAQTLFIRFSLAPGLASGLFLRSARRWAALIVSILRGSLVRTWAIG